MPHLKIEYLLAYQEEPAEWSSLVSTLFLTHVFFSGSTE